MSESLPGGVSVTIVRASKNLHTFTRTRPGPDASWILTTPMSARQKRKLTPERPIEPSSHSLEGRARLGGEEIRRRERRRSVVNNRVRGVTSDHDSTYDLGYGIQPVSKELLWKILDGVAAAKESSIDVDLLNRVITDRRGNRRQP